MYSEEKAAARASMVRIGMSPQFRFGSTYACTYHPPSESRMSIEVSAQLPSVPESGSYIMSNSALGVMIVPARHAGGRMRRRRWLTRAGTEGFTSSLKRRVSSYIRYVCIPGLA